MTMIEILLTLLSCLAGMALGTIFFGGLWWTVRKGVASPRPALWFSVSLLLRMSIALAGIYFVSGGELEKARGVSRWICSRAPVSDVADADKGQNSGGRTCTLLPTR